MMRMTSLLLSPPSILFETISNLRILRDSIFQLNLDFISNSNLNPSGLLPHSYINLDAPLSRIPPANPLSKPSSSHHPSSTTVVVARRRRHLYSEPLPLN
jgi:hypothetical protein